MTIREMEKGKELQFFHAESRKKISFGSRLVPEDILRRFEGLP